MAGSLSTKKRHPLNYFFSYFSWCRFNCSIGSLLGLIRIGPRDPQPWTPWPRKALAHASALETSAPSAHASALETSAHASALETSTHTSALETLPPSSHASAWHQRSDHIFGRHRRSRLLHNFWWLTFGRYAFVWHNFMCHTFGRCFTYFRAFYLCAGLCCSRSAAEISPGLARSTPCFSHSLPELMHFPD